VKARLLKDASSSGPDEIETILVNSLEIARRQAARFWELRTACDLARLWQEQGRDKKGLELLESICNQFTQGFDTVDMQEAKVLMRNLRGILLVQGARTNKVIIPRDTPARRARDNSRPRRR
jgi:hypothetical protein